MVNQQNQHMTQGQSQSNTNPNRNRDAEMDELDFSHDEPTPSFDDLETEAEEDRDQILSEASDVGLTGGAKPGRGPTNDDMSPETLIQEDGARSPNEPGGDFPADKQFSNVSQNEIGGGGGLDEAEMARARPLDGKKWDGNPNEPLSSAPSHDASATNEFDQDLDEDLDEEE